MNRSIKRIIFSTTVKFNGRVEAPIEASQIKQIAGRAGRYRTASQAVEISPKPLIGPDEQGLKMSPDVTPAQTLGLVTSLHQGELSAIQRAMKGQADPIMSAGIFPPDDVLVRFAAYFPPSTPFSYILIRLHNASLLNPRFHLCILKDHLKIADAIEPVQNLTVSDRIIFCASPASVKDTNDPLIPILRALAECVASNSGGGVLDIKGLGLELLETEVTVGSRMFLEQLEYLHKALILYLWLSYRFAGVFNTQAMAFYVKSIVEDKIQQVLSRASFKPRRADQKEFKLERTIQDLERTIQQSGVSENVPSENADDEFMRDIGYEPLAAGLEPQFQVVDGMEGSGAEHETPAESRLDLVSSLRRVNNVLEPVRSGTIA